jgi:flagellar basal body-associated protein FliL
MLFLIKKEVEMLVIYFFITLIALFLAGMVIIHFRNSKEVENDEREAKKREETVKQK